MRRKPIPVDDLANARLSMTAQDVGKKYGLSDSYVRKLTKDHPLRERFIVVRYTKKRKVLSAEEARERLLESKRRYYQRLKTKKLEAEKSKNLKSLIKSSKPEEVKTMNVGHIKHVDKVLQTRVFDLTKQRQIHIPEKKHDDQCIG